MWIPDRTEKQQIEGRVKCGNFSTTNRRFLVILKGKVYEDCWKADNLTLLKHRIRVCLRHIDHNLVYLLLDSTSNRLNKIRINNFIGKRYLIE